MHCQAKQHRVNAKMQMHCAPTSHMSRALDRTEKSTVQKLGHPMLVQAILSQKNQKSKFFNEPFFRNPPISIFPYTKLEAK